MKSGGVTHNRNPLHTHQLIQLAAICKNSPVFNSEFFSNFDGQSLCTFNTHDAAKAKGGGGGFRISNRVLSLSDFTLPCKLSWRVSFFLLGTRKKAKRDSREYVETF